MCFKGFAVTVARNLRLGVCLLLIGGVVSVLAPYATSYVSTSAVVNAPLVALRAPFDGRVGAASPPVATPVTAAEALGLVLGERQDRSELAALRAQAASDAAMIAAIGQESAALSTLSADLAAREAAFRAQVLDANMALQQQIAAELRANRAETVAIALRVRRSRSLAAEGTRPPATLEAELAELAAARAQTARLAALLRDARIERQGVEAGVVPRKSGNSNDYNRQRQDEIAMRLATLATESTRLTVEQGGLADRIAVSEARLDAQGRFDARAAANGVVWHASPPEGAAVLTGDAFLTLLDCDRRFVEVTVPERHFESIRPGAAANVHLLGSADSFVAVVEAVRGAGAKPDHPTFAATPPDVPSGQLHVLIRLPPPADPAAAAAAFCDVGRTAEVRFDRSLESDLRGLRKLRDQVGALVAALWTRAPVLAALP